MSVPEEERIDLSSFSFSCIDVHYPGWLPNAARSIVEDGI